MRSTRSECICRFTLQLILYGYFSFSLLLIPFLGSLRFVSLLVRWVMLVVVREACSDISKFTLIQSACACACVCLCLCVNVLLCFRCCRCSFIHWNFKLDQELTEACLVARLFVFIYCAYISLPSASWSLREIQTLAHTHAPRERPGARARGDSASLPIYFVGSFLCPSFRKHIKLKNFKGYWCSYTMYRRYNTQILYIYVLFFFWPLRTCTGVRACVSV